MLRYSAPPNLHIFIIFVIKSVKYLSIKQQHTQSYHVVYILCKFWELRTRTSILHLFIKTEIQTGLILNGWMLCFINILINILLIW